LAACAPAADAQNVFRCRVQVNDEQMLIQQDDACAQAVEDVAGVAVQWAVART
jgi:hypothetical protein